MSSENHHITKYVLWTICTLIVASVVGVLLLAVFYCVPDTIIRKNAEISIGQIEKENGTGIDEWPLIYSHAWSGKMDSGTDYKELHDIFADSEMDPLHRALSGAGSPRYWKGWYGFLRLFLVFLSYGQMRWFSGSILFVLAWGICIKLKDRLGRFTSFSFLIALILTNFILVPFSVHMSICVTIALCGMLLVLYEYSHNTDMLILWEFFLILGILTSYLDELMAPLLTLGMPLLTVLFCDLFEDNDITIKHSIGKIITVSGAWGIGYAVFWMMRWGINAVFLGTSATDQTSWKLKYWFGQEAEEGGRLYMFAKNILALLPTHGENLVTICVIISFIALLMLILLIKGHRHISKAAIVSILPVLIVSGYPFIWYFVMYKHSLVHATLFTYHDLMITTFGLLTVFFYLIREDKRPDEKTISKMGSN